MKERFVNIAVVLCTLGVAGAGGFWAGKGGNERDLALARELHRHGQELAAIKESLAQLTQWAERPRAQNMNGIGTMPVGTIGPQAVLEAAVQTALQRREEQIRFEQEEQAQPTSENLEAFSQGEQVLNDAVKLKRWTDSSAAGLRQVMNRVSADQAQELMQRLSVAINEGQLAVETEGPPM